MQIYVHKNNQQLGPFTEAEIRAQLAAGTLSAQDHVWWQGQATWLPLAQTPLGTPGAPGVTLISPPPVVPHPAMPAVHGGTSQLAIWSLVCGCASVLCGLFTSIPAIIMGHMSLAEIRKNPAMEGRGMAIAGLVIGYIFLGIFIVAIVAGVVLASLGNNVQDVFKSINSQLNSQSSGSTDDSSANSDSSTNAPDSSTNSATATPVTPDTSTNAAPASQ